MSRSDQYETFMRDVFEHGVEKSDRTGVGTVTPTSNIFTITK